jgi:glycosyltransferase involved in cell wall biosynthesis
VIPVYNEGTHLELVLRTIRKELDKLGEISEIIIVDDSSKDNTWQILQETAAQAPFIKAIRLSRNFGKESAISAGLAMACGEAVIIMDGDLQHPPELIPKMVSIWRRKNANVVEAIKITRGKEPFHKRMGSRLFYRLLRILTGFNFKGASDFKLLDRHAIDALSSMKDRNLFFRGMSAWIGFKRETVEFSVPSRAGGQSGWSLRKLIHLAFTGITSFSSLPLQLITFIGFLFFIFAFILGIQTLYMKITGKAFSGFTTVILLQLIIGSIMMWGLGMIGLYISRIYDEVKGRPRYIIDGTINLEKRIEE